MQLYITDHADPTCGLFPQIFYLDCPLLDTDDSEELEAFRTMAVDMYSEFSIGKITAVYDFEQNATKP